MEAEGGSALQARDCSSAWVEHFPWALLGIRSAPKEVSGVSSVEAVYGIPLPWHFLAKPRDQRECR